MPKAAASPHAVGAILTLIVIWSASMAAVALGLDGHEHPPPMPIALISGGYFAALTAVCLAEEVVDWMGSARPKSMGRPENKTAQLPCRWEGWC